MAPLKHGNMDNLLISNINVSTDINRWPHWSKEENILCKAKDGFISDKKIEHDIEGINILLKSNISKFIIDIERRKYLSIEFNGNIDVKGLINKPDDISFFDFFKKLDYNNTNNLSRLIEENRKIFLSSDNINYFK